MILDKIQIKENLMNRKNVFSYLRVVAFLVVATGVFLASCSGNDAAAVLSSEAAITELTVSFNGKSYPITFDGNNTFGLSLGLAPNEVAPTQFNVDSVTLSDKAQGLKVDDTLSVDNNAVAITITAEDGTQTIYTITILNSEAAITELTVSFNGKSYPITFDGNNTFGLKMVLAPNEVAPTQFNVDSVTLSDKAQGLKVDDPLSVDNNAVAITITAEDGTQATYTISVSYFIFNSVYQKKITDGTKSDDTKKLPSNFMVFDISSNATTQTNVEG